MSVTCALLPIITLCIAERAPRKVPRVADDDPTQAHGEEWNPNIPEDRMDTNMDYGGGQLDGLGNGKRQTALDLSLTNAIRLRPRGLQPRLHQAALVRGE